MKAGVLCLVYLTALPWTSAGCRVPEGRSAPGTTVEGESTPRADSAARAGAPDGPSRAAPVPARLAPEGLQSVATNLGTFRVHHRSDPATIERGKPFRLQAWITREGSREIVPWAELSVDADMPEHLHGMNRVPTVTRQQDGSFLVEGMLFHMPGRWDLYFDVHEAAIVERAQVALDLW